MYKLFLVIYTDGICVTGPDSVAIYIYILCAIYSKTLVLGMKFFVKLMLHDYYSCMI